MYRWRAGRTLADLGHRAKRTRRVRHFCSSESPGDAGALLHSGIELHARTEGSKPAIVDAGDGETLTFEELDRYVRA